MDDLVLKKAELISAGAIGLPEGFQIPVRVSHSTAGPGAGNASIVFAFGRYRVKKAVVFGKEEFELHDNNGSLSITRNGGSFLDDVRIVPVAYHCPEQAFFNLDSRCIYNCAYCSSPLLGKDKIKDLDNGKIMAMVDNAVNNLGVTSVAFTSGVVGSVQETVEMMADIVEQVCRGYPTVTIGVEPYVESKEQIDLLHSAGADEIKINCETANDELFAKVCPELDRRNVFELLEYAVSIFGKGKVASNLIFGLGESDREIGNTIRELANIGVVAGLRPLKITDSNRERIHAALGDVTVVDPERIVRLAELQKTILLEKDLDTRSFSTMCFECTCCDIVPFRDI